MRRNEATQTQVDAADPQSNTWLTANAGSGKTRVLTDRVARLLLDGVDPQNILCLTYTKAAASEMQNRLFKRLGAWSMLSDSDLRRDLQELGVEDQTGKVSLPVARRLFARAIETPGGLKIQTIHSFCSSILRQFPLEAHVSPQFKELDEVASKKLQRECLDEIAVGPNSAILRRFLLHFTGADLSEFVGALSQKKGSFQTPFNPANTRASLSLDAETTADQLLNSVFAFGWSELLKRLIDALESGIATDKKNASLLRGLVDQDISMDLLAKLESVFLFGEKTKSPFGAKIGSLPQKGVREANPELISELNQFMQRVEDGRSTRLALEAFERAQDLHRFGQLFCDTYEARKLALGVLDFDDLISKALALFQDPKVAQWVLYRIDGGIDHLLVDEAQDTSPTQWAVIRALTEEFATGESARQNIRRTIFVVGDKKQSIYSFQGADPKEFDRMQTHFNQALDASNDKLVAPALQHSFRSSPAILRFVDHVFGGDLGPAIGGSATHIAFNSDLPGRVDVWPLLEPSDQNEEKDDWFNPVDQLQDTHHDVRLAEDIAAQIKQMIAENSLPEKNHATGEITFRPISAGDFLILVQRRSDLFAEIIRACKSAGLSVAGADRLQLTAELAVKDICAVLNFLALPEDSLSLAAALRSPLFGWSEQDLYKVAYHRTQDHLWQALRGNTDHPKTLSILNDLRSKSDFLRPYDLIERLLVRHSGRTNLLARLGMEAADAIDALLAQALKYESTGVPSLTGFLCWLETETTEIKRQIDSQSDEIRVMTVHGSKGLEAPIVILPDTAIRRNTVQDDLLTTGDVVHLKPPKSKLPPALNATVEEVKNLQEAERMRLLYVAMTRAESWLIVCGAGKSGAGTDSWYSICERTMTHVDQISARSGPIDFVRSQHGKWLPAQSTKTHAESDETVVVPTFTAPEILSVESSLSPSDLGGAKALTGEVHTGDQGLARGRIIHTLLEHLPGMPISARASVLERVTNSHDDAEALTEDAIASVYSVIDDPNLAWIFDATTLAEVPISAELSELEGRRINGIIDRLIVTEDTVTAVDFKSNAVVPTSVAETPDGLLRQMGAYAAALKQIYPDHKIQTALLWTETAEIMMLPDKVVSDALARVNTP